jgi:hypothetical protein
MKERLRMRGFLPPEDLDLGGLDDVADEDDEPFDEAEA